MRNYFRAITTILLGVAVCLFWGLGYPEALNYHEQNQLWLTTGDYFRERMAVPGGLADYVSEFLVQFYYVPWLGALLIGVVYAAMQWSKERAKEKERIAREKARAKAKEQERLARERAKAKEEKLKADKAAKNG